MKMTIRKLMLLSGVSLLVLVACATKRVGEEPQKKTADVTLSQELGSAQDDERFVEATVKELANPNPETPDDIVERLQEGGLVVFHRYTGAVRGDRSTQAIEGTYDDGQRISETSKTLMKQLGEKYQELGIPVDKVFSSEYFFVWQHADESFGKVLGKTIDIHRDLTGSLFFNNQAELEKSLQGLRNRTVTPPPIGTNTILFSHQGKFDKAFGYYPDAGRTIIFAPDGSGVPRVYANMALEAFLALK